VVAKNFACNLAENRTIESFSLAGCFISGEGVIELCKAIRFNPIVQVFDISGNNVNGETSKTIASILPNMFLNNFKVKRPILDVMMAFSVSMQDHPELAYAAQDYIDIYLNN
jgi:hypothetical protein